MLCFVAIDCLPGTPYSVLQVAREGPLRPRLRKFGTECHQQLFYVLATVAMKNMRTRLYLLCMIELLPAHGRSCGKKRRSRMSSYFHLDSALLNCRGRAVPCTIYGSDWRNSPRSGEVVQHTPYGEDLQWKYRTYWAWTDPQHKIPHGMCRVSGLNMHDDRDDPQLPCIRSF